METLGALKPLAFASIAYSVGGQGVKLSGVIINTKNAFESQLDLSGLCTLSSAKQKMMAVMKAEMSVTDQSTFASDLVSDGSGKTYGERYAYLSACWASLASKSSLRVLDSLNEEEAYLPVLVFVGFGTAVTCLFMAKRRKEK